MNIKVYTFFRFLFFLLLHINLKISFFAQLGTSSQKKYKKISPPPAPTLQIKEITISKIYKTLR